MPALPFGLACVTAGLLLTYGIVWAGAGAPGGARRSFPLLPDRWAVLTVGGLWILIVVFYWLWLHAGGHFSTRDAGESHTVFLTAFNARDFVTSILADHAASPDPEAHPYLYTHHPGVIPRYVSIALIRLGVGFEGQILISLMASALGLAIAYLAIERIISPFYAALFICVTAASYWFFFYGAGDLYRAHLLNAFWLLLFALSRNPRLEHFGWNVFIAAISVLITATDWALTAFFLTFAAIWSSYENGRIPWGWIIGCLALPAAIVLVAHQMLVAYVLGREFWLFDLWASYFARGGWSTGTREAEYLQRYRDASVIVWHASGFVNAQEFLGVLVRTFVRNSGLLGLVYVVALPAMIVHAASGRRWPIGVIVLVTVPAVAALAGVAPFQVIALSVVVLALHLALRRPANEDELTRAATFGLLLFAAMLIQSAVFPWYSFQILLTEGRAPFGLIYSALFAQVALFIARCLVSSVDSLAWIKQPRRWVAIAALTALLLVAAAGCPGWLMALVAFPLGLVWAQSARANDQAAGSRAGQRWGADLVRLIEVKFGSDVFWPLLRWSCALVLVGLAMLVVYATRAVPSSFARNLLAVVLLIVGYAIGGGVEWDRLYNGLRQSGGRLVGAFAGRFQTPLDRPLLRGWRVAGTILVLLFTLQIGWSVVQGLRWPPIKPPYADILRNPPFAGASFLVWAYDGVPWLYTRGWTFTSATIPPDTSQPNLRWRHLADWQNEVKYSRPQFFLCDQSRFRWDTIRLPGDISGPTTTPPAGLQCKVPARCTCEDVAAEMMKQGHKVEMLTPEFSIIRFSWQP